VRLVHRQPLEVVQCLPAQAIIDVMDRVRPIVCRREDRKLRYARHSVLFK
jgi:hypothetical protein